MSTTAAESSQATVTIDASAAVHHRGGIGRYTTELLTSLQALPHHWRFKIFFNRPDDARIPPQLSSLPQRRLPWGDKRWRLATFFSLLLNISQERQVGRSDIFHATDHLLPCLPQTRTVFTLHDLTFLSHPFAHNPLNRWYLTLAMPLFLRKADHIIAVSQATANEAVARYHIKPTKVSVIPEGVSPHFRPMEEKAVWERVQRTYGLPSCYILFVGTVEPRKNLSSLLQAYRHAHLHRYSLVIAGKLGWRYKNIVRQVKQLGLEDRVKFLGYVDENDLPVIYSKASLFVYPSLYEGFGLPVLEAMACGTPVITSNVASLPEIAGDAAILVSPLNIAELATQIRFVLTNADQRQRMKVCGLRRARQYTWERAAKATLRLYEDLMQDMSAE